MTARQAAGLSVRALVFSALAAGLSGCLATQDDIVGLGERTVRVETRLEALERETRQDREQFEAEWLRRLASLNEDLRQQRDRVHNAEGRIDDMRDLIARESERAERFRSSTGVELTEFQRTMTARLEDFRAELERETRERVDGLETGVRSEIAAVRSDVESVRSRLDEVSALREELVEGRRDQVRVSEQQVLLSDRVDEVDTALAEHARLTAERIGVVVEEVDRENRRLREEISAVRTRAAELESAVSRLSSGLEELRRKMPPAEAD